MSKLFRNLEFSCLNLPFPSINRNKAPLGGTLLHVRMRLNPERVEPVCLCFFYKGILRCQLELQYLTFRCLNQDEPPLPSGMFLEQSLYLKTNGGEGSNTGQKDKPVRAVTSSWPRRRLQWEIQPGTEAVQRGGTCKKVQCYRGHNTNAIQF